MEKLGAQCDEQDDKLLKTEETEVKATACQPRSSKFFVERRVPALPCRQHKKIQCP